MKNNVGFVCTYTHIMRYVGNGFWKTFTLIATCTCIAMYTCVWPFYASSNIFVVFCCLRWIDSGVSKPNHICEEQFWTAESFWGLYFRLPSWHGVSPPHMKPDAIQYSVVLHSILSHNGAFSFLLLFSAWYWFYSLCMPLMGLYSWEFGKGEPPLFEEINIHTLKNSHLWHDGPSVLDVGYFFRSSVITLCWTSLTLLISKCGLSQLLPELLRSLCRECGWNGGEKKFEWKRYVAR